MRRSIPTFACLLLSALLASRAHAAMEFRLEPATCVPGQPFRATLSFDPTSTFYAELRVNELDLWNAWLNCSYCLSAPAATLELTGVIPEDQPVGDLALTGELRGLQETPTTFTHALHVIHPFDTPTASRNASGVHVRAALLETPMPEGVLQVRAPGKWWIEVARWYAQPGLGYVEAVDAEPLSSDSLEYRIGGWWVGVLTFSRPVGVSPVPQPTVPAGLGLSGARHDGSQLTLFFAHERREDATLEVFDISGRRIAEARALAASAAPRMSLPMALPRGAYVLVLTSPSSTERRKLLVTQH